ncbi:MAG: asparagine synthase (glutamine-hydrolyzing) [Candidatus Methanomethylicaceae archaeon]
MCGICGKLNFDHQEPVDPELIRRMMDLLYHRGPDGGGMYCTGSIGLGHRRLSIIDLSTGDQPMCNETGTIWVVYNGEIYNFRELRISLEAKGHRFKSQSDTEVIIHSYEEWGTESVQRLRGMFAFALWDERRRSLFLARDRVGIKPLYYINTGSSLIFASEIKAILADPCVERQINPLAVDRFFTYGYLPGPETLMRGIYKLEPGHCMTVINGRIAKNQYWDLHFKVSSRWKRFDEAVEELQELLSYTVRDHMVSDVPVGVLLSGGVDSTGILRYAVEHTDRPIHTFTIGFEGEGFADERYYARLAAGRFGTIHQDITMTAEDFRDFLPKYVWHMEEPVFEPPAVALYYVSRLARASGIKVLLSGEGGDEAFAGYQNYRNLLLLEKLKSTLGPAKVILGHGLKTLGCLGWGRLGKYAVLVDRSMSDYYFSRTATPDSGLNQFKRLFYTKEFIELLRGIRSDEPTRSLFGQLNRCSPLNSMLYVDTKTWLPDDLLLKADKMTMATSVELRVPLLDFKILEFAASLPESYKVKGLKTKHILKAALKDSLPQKILHRRKTGFPVPYDKWMKRDIQYYMDEIISSLNLGWDAYFRGDGLQRLILTLEESGYLYKAVFSLFVLALWKRKLAEK